MAEFNHPMMNQLMLGRRDAADRADKPKVSGDTGEGSKAIANPADVFGTMFGDIHRHMNDMMQSMMSFPERSVS